MITRARIYPVLFATIVAAAFFANGTFAAQKIGVASAVKNSVDVVGAGARPLSNGSDVGANERIRTGQQSTTQLLFLDQTTLNIGAQSEVVLDRFVYDPNGGAGKVVINAGVGVFRFVTGAQK